MNQIVPLNEIERRAPEAGRIRIGVKTARAMKAIDTFRFTSPHQAAIEKLAELYGGTAQPWSDPKVAAGQWEVITKASSILILVQPGGLSQYYELWSGGGCERRCDGVTVEVPGPDEMMQSPCICQRKGQMDCRPYTRLNVILPNVDFYGTWRLETKGWNAVKELPGMFDLVTALAESGAMVRAHLNLEHRKKIHRGKTKQFVVPTISVESSPDELLAGGGTARAELGASEEQPALTAGPSQSVDDEVIEAEVVDDEFLEAEAILEEQVRTIADEHGHDPQIVVATLWQQADGDHKKIQSFIDKSKTGKQLRFTKNQTLTWRSADG